MHVTSKAIQSPPFLRMPQSLALPSFLERASFPCVNSYNNEDQCNAMATFLIIQGKTTRQDNMHNSIVLEYGGKWWGKKTNHKGIQPAMAAQMLMANTTFHHVSPVL